MNGVSDYRNRGIQLLQQGTEFDDAGRYTEALESYTSGIECLRRAITQSKIEQVRAALMERAASFLDRAETLKRHIDGERRPKEEKEEKGTTLDKGAMVSWDDIAGLTEAKASLREAVEDPVKLAHLFDSKRLKSCSGILLYGPPGTGKTMLAKAAASCIEATFHFATASMLTGKYVGETEQNVRELFEKARKKRPAIVFIDEFEALCGERGATEASGGTDHLLRAKTEFLQQMDGVSSDMKDVLVMGATNFPWRLDTAIQRRFPKRIYIPLPDEATRAQLILVLLGDIPHNVSQSDAELVAACTEGWSGSDLAALIDDARYRAMRVARGAVVFQETVEGALIPLERRTPNDNSVGRVHETTLDQIMQAGLGERLELPPVSMEDLEASLKKNKPSMKPPIVKYDQYTKAYGTTGK